MVVTNEGLAGLVHEGSGGGGAGPVVEVSGGRALDAGPELAAEDTGPGHAGGHADVESDVSLGLVDLLLRLLPFALGHGARPEGALVVNVDVPVLKQGPEKTRYLGKSSKVLLNLTEMKLTLGRLLRCDQCVRAHLSRPPFCSFV